MASCWCRPWAGLPLLAAIPLMLYFHRAGMPLSFTGAYFEAMSGLTTTGATVLTNLTRCRRPSTCGAPR